MDDRRGLEDTSAESRRTLLESDARYRAALVAGRMGSWETDLVERTRVWSEEGMALFGIALADGRGRVGGEDDEYVNAIHADDRHLVAHFHGVADRQDSFPAEYRIVRPDGAVLWLAGRGLVVARTGDGLAHRIVSIMADVTDRRRAEDGLRIERERLDLALQAGQMGVWDLDLRHGTLWWSRHTYGVFGVDPASFVPDQVSVAALIHPEDRETFLQRRAEAILQRRPFIHEFRVVRGDGTVAWIGHRAQTEYDAAGTPVRTFGTAVDITERKAAEHALREADRKKDDFIATLAHELRNPLAPMRNAVALLRRDDLSAAQAATCRDVVDRQVAQMAHLLDDLLDVSRMSRGRFELRRSPLEMSAVIAQAVEIAQPLIDDAGHAFAVRLPEAALHVEGDLTRLAQVFSNLLLNAAKYTPAGGLLAISAQAAGSEVVVSVTDNGIGIDAGHLPHVFEMFGQLESALDRSRGGLGIGLSLARRLVEMHGGSIAAASPGAGLGSEFVVRLPLCRPATTTRPGDRRAESPAGRCRVLVADDLRDSADTLGLLLESMGHVVHIAYDGAEALRLAETFRPDIVLLDLGMPKLNGFDACRQIRAQPWGSRMVLAAQTGWGQAQDRQRTREAGFDAHIVKPIDADALEALLRSVGGRSRGAAPLATT